MHGLSVYHYLFQFLSPLSCSFKYTGFFISLVKFIQGDQSQVFIRTDAEAETPILWLPLAKS